MNSTLNVSLQVVGVGAISSAVISFTNHDLAAGISLAILGIACYLIYEFTPSK